MNVHAETQELYERVLKSSQPDKVLIYQQAELYKN